ncbi:zinc ribbon domain-containing protein [Streptomyces sp. NPDC002564]|uniref:zinc ribbon domain-containing protein n=1 Tax=Streptomyces sp. NPDC002564 TaxID=3364649 RepID=UPI0036B53B8F
MPVLPARPMAPRPVVRTQPSGRGPDGPPCPACGTPNRAGRTFCRRCAARLTPPAAVATLPWWRRRRPRRRAGSGSRAVLRRVLTVLAVLAVLAAVVLLVPAGRALFEDTRDKLGKATEVAPTKVSASAEVPGHPAAMAADGLSNRYWGSPRPGAGVSFEFGKPFRLVAMVVHTGPSAKAQQFRRQERPVEAELVVTAADGSLHRKNLTFNDKPGPQTVQLGVSDVVKARLVLRAVTGTRPGRHVALAEVEFFRRT